MEAGNQDTTGGSGPGSILNGEYISMRWGVLWMLTSAWPSPDGRVRNGRGSPCRWAEVDAARAVVTADDSASGCCARRPGVSPWGEQPRPAASAAA